MEHAVGSASVTDPTRMCSLDASHDARRAPSVQRSNVLAFAIYTPQSRHRVPVRGDLSACVTFRLCEPKRSTHCCKMTLQHNASGVRRKWCVNGGELQREEVGTM
ncbi:unnamed protein product [Toxocara canis]|uniref:Uncharacterized protein n=1 Tax=Toxocara canis TaxID=6265 RepID=A0A183URM7_TOXCA|nr:unnamed protein product [Toxocara canis]